METQVKEVTIILKNEERSYREKFLVYDDFQMDAEHPVLRECLDKARANFVCEPDDIAIKVSMVIL